MNTKEQFTTYNKKLSTIEYGKEGPTAIPLVEEVLDSLKLDWSNPNLKILDPAFGFGTFLYFSYLRLLKYHDKTHILNNMLYGYEIEPFRYQLTKNILKIKNLYNSDFLQGEKIMEFNCIITNPPFQKSNNKRWKQWVSFIDKALPLLTKDAYLSFVTPISWLEGFGNELELARNLLYSKDIKYVNVNVDKYFKNVNERIGYFIVKNNKYSGTTTIKNNDTIETINISEYSTNPLQKSISNKVFSSQNKVEYKNFLSYKNKDIDGKKCSEKKDNIYSIKVVHSGSQVLYYNPLYISDKYFGKKIIVNMSGHYFYEGKNYIHYTNEAIPGRNTVGVYVNDENKDNIEFILKSKLYRYIIYTNKTSGFNSGPFKNLPKFTEKLVKCETDKDLYSYFNLTNEEVKEVENYLG